MKKRLAYIGILAGVVAIVVVAGTAFAQSAGDSAGKSPRTTVISRMASILGLEESRVQDAYNQAVKESRSEALQQRLDQMVQNGRLTKEQADQYRTWLKQRPDVPLPMPGISGGHGMRGFPGHGGGPDKGMRMLPPMQPAPRQSSSTTTGLIL